MSTAMVGREVGVGGGVADMVIDGMGLSVPAGFTGVRLPSGELVPMTEEELAADLGMTLEEYYELDREFEITDAQFASGELVPMTVEEYRAYRARRGLKRG